MKIISDENLKESSFEDIEETTFIYSLGKSSIYYQNHSDNILSVSPRDDLAKLVIFPPYGFGGVFFSSSPIDIDFEDFKQALIEKIKKRSNEKFSSIVESNDKIYLNGRGFYLHLNYLKGWILFHAKYWVVKSLEGEDMIQIFKELVEETFEN